MASRPLVFEASGFGMRRNTEVGFNSEGHSLPIQDDGARVGWMECRHAGKMNLLFADGHVKSSPQLDNLNMLRINDYWPTP